MTYLFLVNAMASYSLERSCILESAALKHLPLYGYVHRGRAFCSMSTEKIQSKNPHQLQIIFCGPAAAPIPRNVPLLLRKADLGNASPMNISRAEGTIYPSGQVFEDMKCNK